jgi:rubrerythrin
MAKRHAGDKSRAVKAPARIAAGSKVGVALTATSGKSLAQMQAQQMAERMFTDMMASAGASSRSMMAEVLYWIPDDFRDAYIGMTVQALRGTDGGTEERNKAGDETAAVGKAARKTHGGGGKKYKKYWVVQDEDLLELKTRMDKRLRAMAREIMEILETKEQAAQLYREWASTEAIAGEEQRKDAQRRLRQESALVRRGRRMTICESCRQLVSATWKFCPSCGKPQEIARKGRTNRSSTS